MSSDLSQIMLPALGLWVLLLASIGCARPGQTPKERPSREEIQVVAAEELGGKHVYRARYNPPLCPCPAFEVEAGSLWVRVALVDHDEDRPVRQELKRFVQENRGAKRGAIYLIGTLEPDRVQYSATGLPVMEFVLEGFTETFPVSAAPASLKPSED